MSIIPALPYTLTNGQTADATQVMANFNDIVAGTNANAAPLNAPDFPNNVTIGGSLSVAGVTTLTGAVTMDGGATIADGETLTGGLTVDTITTSGFVGVGQATGVEAVMVDGAVTSTGPAANFNAGPARASMDANGGNVRIGGVSGVGSNPTTELISGGSAIATLTTNGGMQVGAPTGGDQGAGTLNAQALYVGGNSLGDGAADAVPNGFVDLPGGIIEQWGQNTVNLNTTLGISFPKPFPNGVFSIVVTPVGTFVVSANQQIPNAAPVNKSGFNLTNPSSSGSSTTSFYWRAIGN